MKIWLVGAGYWGSKVKEELQQFSDITDIQIIDIKQGKTIDDITSLDPVILATPLWQHHKQTIELLKRKHDVYVEKPMAETTEQLLDIKKHLNKNQILMAGHIYLYNPLLQKMRDIINDGILGDVKFIESRRLNWGIRQTKTTPVLSLAPHDISIIRHLLGDIDVTYAHSQNLSNNIVDDSVTFGGYNFEVKVSWWWPFRERKVIVIGDKGQAIWDDDLKEITVTYGFLEGKYPVKKLEGKSYDDKSNRSPLYFELGHFISCCKNKLQPISNIDNAIGIGKNIDQVSNLLSK